MEDAVRLGALAAATSATAPAHQSPSRVIAGAPLRLWVYACASMVLCLCDALFTLKLIESSHFYEANPVMDSLMRVNTWLFVATKLLVTAVSLGVLLRYADRTLFGRLRVTHLLFGTFGMYAVLVSYELAMLTVVL